MIHYALLLLIVFAGSCRQDRIDLVREIPPHTTRPIVLYDVPSVSLPYERFSFRWDLGKLTGQEVTGHTDDLGADELVCHTLDDVNRHTAWVKRVLPATLNDVMMAEGINEGQRDRVLIVVSAVLDRYLVGQAPRKERRKEHHRP